MVAGCDFVGIMTYPDPLMSHDATFTPLFDADSEEIAADLRREHCRLIGDRIRWIARVAVNLYPRVLAVEEEFRAHCIAEGIARHGRTVCMVVRWLCGDLDNTTCQRWAIASCGA